MDEATSPFSFVQRIAGLVASSTTDNRYISVGKALGIARTQTVIRFHLDENMPHAVADGLRLRDRDVTTSSEAGLSAASDREQLVFAHQNGRVLVTQDDDLLSLAAGG